MSPVRTRSQETFDRVNEVLNPDGEMSKAGIVSQATWAPIQQTSNSTWVDLYNKDPVKELAWAAGQPKST